MYRAEPEAVHGREWRVADAGGGEAAGPRGAGEGRRPPTAVYPAVRHHHAAPHTLPSSLLVIGPNSYKDIKP